MLKKKYNLSISVVLYNTNVYEIESVIATIEKVSLKVKLYFVDNSSHRNLEQHIKQNNGIEYIFAGRNLGYGAGHNMAIDKARSLSEFHLILNADVSFESALLERIYLYMKKRPDIGLVAPKVFNPDGSIQYSVKLLPTPTNLIVRRFIPIKTLKRKLDYKYEFHFFNFNRSIEIPYAMGCFLFINTKVFDVVKGFDERFFMYPEDIDLTRRIYKHYRTIYNPDFTITHKHGRGSYKSYRLLYYHVTSMIKYFNKWGWFLDKERKSINKKILKQFND